MYVGLKQPRGGGERYVTPARAAAKETTLSLVRIRAQDQGALVRISSSSVRAEASLKSSVFAGLHYYFSAIK